MQNNDSLVIADDVDDGEEDEDDGIDKNNESVVTVGRETIVEGDQCVAKQVSKFREVQKSSF